MRAVYLLLDPRDSTIRYVGIANDPTSRLRHHLCDSKKMKTHKDRWIQSLMRLSLLPKLEIVEWSTTPKASEIAWIARLKEQGANLVNSTLGGDGVLMTEEVRRKIGAASSLRTPPNRSGAKLSIETKSLISKSLTGKKRSEESRSKQSTSRKGWKMTEQHRQSIIASNRSRRRKAIENTNLLPTAGSTIVSGSTRPAPSLDGL